MTAPPTIDSHGRNERLGSPAPPRVIDVRTSREFETAHIAGAYNVVLISILSSIAPPKLKWAAAAMGGGLTVASLTDTCAMAMALSQLPYKRGVTCDAQTVVVHLVGSPSDQKVGQPA